MSESRDYRLGSHRLQHSTAGCTAGGTFGCQEIPAVVGWLFGPLIVALVAWALVALVRAERGFGRSAIVALGGTVLGYLVVYLWDGWAYGTPRPPLAVLAFCGAMGFLAVAALLDGGSRQRIAVSALAGVVLVAGLIGSGTASSPDRSHQFNALRPILLAPPASNFTITSADAYVRFSTVRLQLTPTGGGPVIGAHGSTLAMAFPSDVTAPVPEDQLHALITSLEPVEPSVLAGLKAGH